MSVNFLQITFNCATIIIFFTEKPQSAMKKEQKTTIHHTRDNKTTDTHPVLQYGDKNHLPKESPINQSIPIANFRTNNLYAMTINFFIL